MPADRPQITPDDAKSFAEHHVAVWNGHNIDDILALYADDVELSSPLAAELTGGGVVRGKTALRGYFARGLEAYPDLRFTLVDKLLCVDSVTLYYRSINERMVAEVMFLDEDRRVRRVFAHYAC